jgi:hypothetical protein
MDPRYAGIEFIPPPGRPRVSIAIDGGKREKRRAKCSKRRGESSGWLGVSHRFNVTPGEREALPSR